MRISISSLAVGLVITSIGCSIDLPSSSHHSDLVGKHRDTSDAVPQDVNFDAPVPAVKGAHPRLFFADSEIPAIKLAISREPLLAHEFESLRHEGEKMLTAPPAEYVRDTEKSLIQSRLVLARVGTLAGLYRLTGEERFAVRAREEMLAAAAFPDWHPADFLPDAELINAMSVGYDWLYRYLRREDRDVIRAAILEKGLQPAKSAYDRSDDWTRTESNHNIVGNGGVAIGAMALGDEQPKLAHDLVADSRRSLPAAMGQYEPDGAWPEGPIYWDYATRYATFYMASLDSVIGTNFDLSRWPGLASTGLFRIQSTGPTKKTFNFGDAEEVVHPAGFMYWFAKQFNKPVYAAHEDFVTPESPNIFALIWRARLPAGESFEPLATRTLPTSAIFRGSELAFMRSDWSPDATWVGFKGGTNKGTHRHLDLGSFVLDALGERWALDLGPDDYGLPGYNGSDKRWGYYRCETAGHNTLTINGPNQDFEGDATLVGFHSDPQRSYAVVDLTHAYTHAKSVLRGIELLDGHDVMVVDEINMASPSRVTWNFHTGATVSAEGTTAILKQNGKQLRMQILEPAGATFEVVSAAATPPQKRNAGVSNVTIHLPALVEKTRIVVRLTPVSGERVVRNEETRSPKIESLKSWVEAGRIRR